MTSTNLQQRLRSAYLFAELTNEQLETVLHNAQLIQLNAGDVLFSHGQPAEHFYWLSSGLIKLGRMSPNGEEMIVELISPEQTFAEAIMFMDNHGNFPVSAHAVEASTVLQIENKALINQLRNSVESCFRMMATMSRRLHQQINEIDRLTLQNAYERVSYYLLEHAISINEVSQVELKIAKHMLASRLAIKPETLSRIFARLTREDVIEVHGTTIILKNVAALRAF